MYVFDWAQFKVLNFKRVWNITKLFSSYYASRWTKHVRLSGFPVVLSVEPTSYCNLKCPQCPTGMGTLSRSAGYMDFDVYCSIIDELGDYLTNVQLFFQGEPFMHKQLPQMIRYARQKNIYTLTSTNGHFLNAKTVDAILDSGLNALVIGLEGVSPEVYRFYRQNGKFDTVVQGIKHLIAVRNKRKLKHPKICLQFIVMKSNQDQVDAVKRFGRELNVDNVVIKTAQIYPDTNIDDFLPDEPALSRYKKVDGKLQLNVSVPNHCKRVWTTAVITWDGTLASCCFDKDAEHSFGIWNGMQFYELWRSERAMQFRRQILKDRSAIPMCSNCTEGIREFL